MLIDKIAFTLPIFGGLEVRWYGIIITLGIVAGLVYALLRTKTEGIPADDILDYAILTVILAIIGAHIGTRLQLTVDERYLKLVLLLVLPVIAAILLKKKELPEERQEMPKWRRGWIAWGFSLVIGTYDGFYGPGTGTFLLLTFCYLAKIDVRTASGNVKLVNLASNIGALVTSLIAGKVIISIGLISAVFSIAGQYLGAGLALKNGSKIVRPVIFTVLALLAVKVIFELL